MSNDLLEITGHQAAGGPAKRQKVVHHRDPPRRPRAARIFAPFRTVGLVSPTSVPFTSLPLGKTTFQITTSVGRCLHTYDLRRGLNLVFISRPQTPALITATVAWKEQVLAAWGGKAPEDDIGVWAFERGKKSGELEIPHDLHEPIGEIVAFGSWIIGRCSTRIEVWKSAKYEHYTTITPTPSRGMARGNLLSGGICNIPTYLNKVLVGKKDGSVDIWNVSTGKLVYTILPPNLDSGAVTALQPTPALSLVAIARADGSISIQDVRTDKAVLKLRHRDRNGASISSISFRTDGHGAGEDGREPGIMATAAFEDSDVTLWDLNNGGRVVGILHGAHNPPSSHCKGDSVSGGISKIEFLPGQDVMITSGLDNALKSWIFDANSLSNVPRILHSRSGHAAPVTKLGFMPTNSEDADSTGKWLLSAGRDQSLWGWSIRRDGQSSELSQGPARKKAKKLGLLSKTLEMDSSVKLEELKAPEITCFASSLNRDGGMGATPGAGRIWANVASKKGTNDTSESGSTGWESVVTGHRGDKYARTWFWGRKRAGRWAFETGDGKEVSAVALSSCGTFALVASIGGSISMFNLQSGILRQRFPAPLTPAQAKKLKLTDPDTQKPSPLMPHFGPGEGRHRRAVTGLMVDQLNRTVISCGLDGKIKFWDFRSGMLQDEIDWNPMTAITAAAYYKSSDLVALSCDDLSIRIVDTETKKLVRELWGCTGQISDFCFSNDGRWIVAASMDSVIRIWDLPTAHLVNAFKVESLCTALAFSDTGEYLATAHADSVGVNLWNNRTLFTQVPTRMIRDDEIIEATLPTTSGEDGEGLLSAALEDMDTAVEGEDNLTENDSSAVDTLSNDLLTLSLVPKARWQTLLHLSEIRARNKPKEPPKAPEKAPFFLPSLANGEDAGQLKALTNGDSASKISSATSNAKSHIFRPSLTSTSRSQFTALLHAFARSEDQDPGPFLAHLSSLAPAAADSEVRSLANFVEMTAFVQALTARLRQKRDYELVQTWMSVFLRCHSGEIIGSGEKVEALREAMGEWRREQGREGHTLHDPAKGAYYSAIPSSKFIVDGPGLAYHIYHRLCANRSESLDPLNAIPSYRDIGRHVIIFLDALEAYSHKISHIYFDGFLPQTKREVRLARLESLLRGLVRTQDQYSGGFAVPQSMDDRLYEPADLYNSTRSLNPPLRKIPTPPFLVPAVLDALAQSGYASITKMVPGEADFSCAQATKDLGGIVLTSDSDMLVHDLGEDGSVVFLHHLEIRSEPSRETQKCNSRLTGIVQRPAETAQKFGLPNLQRLAYEIKADPTIGFSEALRRTRQPIEDHTALQDFLEDYTSATCDSTLDLLADQPLHPTSFLDPRLSEFVLQLDHHRNEDIRIYLPFLMDDPSRSSAWNVSFSLRQLTYSILASYTPNYPTSITEISRKGFRILPCAIHLSPSSIQDSVNSLLANLKATKAYFSDVPPVFQYRIFALLESLRWYRSSDRNLPSRSSLTSALTNDYPKSSLTWIEIHLEAQYHAVLYALRMLKQSTSHILAHKVGRDTGLMKITETLVDLPPLEGLMPSRDETRKGFEKTKLDTSKLFQFLNGQIGTSE
ncbi:MAG: hypothetical protein Q9203_004785 [Teloschistes exilis]